MKTAPELLELFKDYFDNCRNGAEWFEVPREDLEPILATIQQDAFESGRVEVLRVLGECVSSIEELDWSYDHNSLDVLERREMALKHARKILGITDRKEFLKSQEPPPPTKTTEK